jgi:hypothetical protein
MEKKNLRVITEKCFQLKKWIPRQFRIQGKKQSKQFLFPFIWRLRVGLLLQGFCIGMAYGLHIQPEYSVCCLLRCQGLFLTEYRYTNSDAGLHLREATMVLRTNQVEGMFFSHFQFAMVFEILQPFCVK